MTKAAVVRSHPEIALTRKQRALLSDALMHADEARDTMEDALVQFGRWVLVHVFEDDAKAALDGKRENPVWHELLRRAGGPTLHLSRKLLYVALQIAAHDKRINDEAWRKLEPGRKELLLPIGDEGLMREAAQHVLAMKLTQRATRDYVQSLRARAQDVRTTRITPKSFAKRLKTFREALATDAVAKRLADSLPKVATTERHDALREVRALEKWVGKLRARLERA